jgi:hypothetical protein
MARPRKADSTGTASPAPPKVAPVAISAEVHQAIGRIAEQRTGAEGKRITIRQVIEDAVRAHYRIFFIEEAPSKPATDPRQGVLEALIGFAEPEIRRAISKIEDDEEPSADPIEEVFGQLIEAAFAGGSPQEQSKAVEGLFGTVAGSFRQRIKLKDLAYHLRTSSAPIASMADLIEDYEAGGVAALQRDLEGEEAGP